METSKGMPAASLPSVSLVPHAGRTGREAWMANWMHRPEMHFVEPAAANSPGGAATNQMHAEILDSFLFGGAVSARPDADGNFSLPNVYPGRYRIVPMPPPALPYYLDAVRMGETMRRVVLATEDAAEGRAAAAEGREPRWRARSSPSRSSCCWTSPPADSMRARWRSSAS